MKFFQQRNFYIGRLEISLYQTGGRPEIGIGYDVNMRPGLFFLCFIFWSIEISVLSKEDAEFEWREKQRKFEYEQEEEIDLPF